MKAIGLLVICGLIAVATSAAVENDALKALIPGSNKFAWDLYMKLSKSTEGNVIVSPASIQFLLALTHAGAKGRAAEEISSTLGFPDDEQTILTGHKRLLEELQDPVLKIANRMFSDKSAEIKPEFQRIGSEYFNAPAENLDFQTHPDESREHINQWVENNTNHLIQNLLPKDSITPLTRLVLVNAVHFKANWLHKFEESSTFKEPFHISANEKIDVDMMHMHQEDLYFKHDEELAAKVLKLPYEGEKYSLVMILPDQIEGLSEVEEKLSHMTLQEVTSKMRRSSVIISLPKFKMEETMDLNNILKEMGMPTIFSSPDFSGISDSALAVSKVVQKAFIKVNEEGTEAAAATGVEDGARSLRLPKEKKFKADRPFLFYIARDESSPAQIVLFVGSLKKPTPSTSDDGSD